MPDQEKPKTKMSYFLEVVTGLTLLVIFGSIVSMAVNRYLNPTPYEEPYGGGYHSYGQTNPTWCRDVDVRATASKSDPVCRVLICDVDGKPLPPVVLFCRGGDVLWKR